MSVIGAVQALFTSDTGEWSKGCKTATRELDDTSQKTKKSFKEIRAGMAETFGKKSELAQTLKLLKGGGAIAGLSILGNSLKQWSGDIQEIAVGMAMGSKSGNDMAVGIAKGLPVIGGYASALENVLGLVTGTTVAIAKNNQEIAEGAAVWASQAAQAKAYKSMVASLHVDMERAQRNIAKASADPLTQARLTAAQGLADAHLANAEKLKADIEALDAAAKPELDTLRAQAQRGDMNASEQLKIRMGKLQAEKNDIRRQVTNLDELAIAQNATDLAEAERKVNEAQSKASFESFKGLQTAQSEARIAVMKLAGHTEMAEAQAIADKLAAQQAANLQAARDKIAELKLTSDAPLAHNLLDNAAKQNAALAANARAEVAQIQANKNKELTEESGTDVDRFNAQLKEYKRLLNDGVITLEVYQKARTSAMDKFRESILPHTAEESAIDSYKKKVKELTDAFKSGLINKGQMKNGVAELQTELSKAATPEFQQSEDQVRRFNFGRLSAPQMASPIKGLLKVTEDNAQTQKDIAAAIGQTNDILRANLTPTPISLK